MISIRSKQTCSFNSKVTHGVKAIEFSGIELMFLLVVVFTSGIVLFCFVALRKLTGIVQEKCECNGPGQQGVRSPNKNPAPKQTVPHSAVLQWHRG